MADRRTQAAPRRRAPVPGGAEAPGAPGTSAHDRDGDHTSEAGSMWAARRPDGTVSAGWYLLPLRLFLGVTFLYAGLQKLANPDFFRDSSPISIHAQLVAATRSSPVHALVSPLVHVSTAVGVLFAVGELAVAAGTLLGLLTRAAAAGGLLLNLLLFLTVSFHSTPYFTGSDIVFVFAWTPFILAGAAGAPALDTWLATSRRGQPLGAVGGGSSGVSRRAVVSEGAVIGAVAAGVVVLGGAVAALGRAIGGTGSGATNVRSLSPPATSSSNGSGTGTGSSSGTPPGTAIGPASGVPVGGAASFTVPKNGDPGLVIQRTAGEFVAFDATCPHAGCTVAYQAASQIIACPCHGSEFNPSNGDVVRGPAATGLVTLRIAKGPNGDLYVQG
ncbi:MAG TPA: Rieske 2Fe-2S domain-containing protein [Acidimicrobiales bacterium]|nr:Rieske 2Fe-2S domain-containing protein [Acidimicrobiales bacterium]